MNILYNDFETKVTLQTDYKRINRWLLRGRFPDFRTDNR